jgi:2-phosphosulfolactate phosphatase
MHTRRESIPDQGFSPLHVVFTPEEIEGMSLLGYRVVILDVLRATSAICAGLYAGIRCFRPVLTIDDSLALADQGYIPAAERGGLVAPGFEVGNSPLVFGEPRFRDTKIALTTTNGTRALWSAKGAGATEILVGSFVGLEVLVKELRQHQCPTVLLCSGWQGKFCLEDTLLAGALADAMLVANQVPHIPGQVPHIPGSYRAADDRVQAAQSLWLQHRHDLQAAVRLSSHYSRLASAGLEQDITFCMQLNAAPAFGRLVGVDLVLGN